MTRKKNLMKRVTRLIVFNMVENMLAQFRSMKIKKFSWVPQSDVPSIEINNALLAHGLIFKESFATEMSIDLSVLPEDQPIRTSK